MASKALSRIALVGIVVTVVLVVAIAAIFSTNPPSQRPIVIVLTTGAVGSTSYATGTAIACVGWIGRGVANWVCPRIKTTTAVTMAMAMTMPIIKNIFDAPRTFSYLVMS